MDCGFGSCRREMKWNPEMYTYIYMNGKEQHQQQQQQQQQ